MFKVFIYQGYQNNTAVNHCLDLMFISVAYNITAAALNMTAENQTCGVSAGQSPSEKYWE